jgi:hypothetical protein
MADDFEKFEQPATVQERRTDEEVRTALADAYTFVRSREINKTIAGFTFDHYIDEAKRSIKEERVLRSASSPAEGVGRRMSKLSALEKIKIDFKNAMTKARELAKQNDALQEPAAP